jgi:uncharacterized membrane protein YdfJ with MMPL/SSD domain
VLGVAAVAVVVAAVFGIPVVNRLHTALSDFEDPSSQTYKAARVIEHTLHIQDPAGVVVLLPIPGNPRTNPKSRELIAAVAALLHRQKGVKGVQTDASGELPFQLSRNGRETLVLASFRTRQLGYEAAQRLKPKLKPYGALVSGVDVVFEELTRRSRTDLERAELYALPLLVLLSLLVFRTVVAALLPLLVGASAVLFTFLALRLISSALDLSVFALNLVSALGLGLAVDYSLFVVARFREELGRGLDPRGAVEVTLASAGRTVLYSALSVGTALAALCVFPLPFLYSMGIAGALTAFFCGAVALLVLPSLLLLLGGRVNALALRPVRSSQDTFWGRLAQRVMARPATVALASGALLIAAGSPVFALGLTPADTSLLPPKTPSRVVEERIEHRFRSNPALPIDAVIEAPGNRFPVLLEYVQFLERVANYPHNGLLVNLVPGKWLLLINPTGDPFGKRNEAAIARMRAGEAVFPTYVGGITAWFHDEVGALSGNLPWALLAIVLTMLAAVFALTGSVVLPLKTVVMNGLTLCVATGALVLCFQDGLLGGPLDFRANGGLEPANLTLLYTVAFALSSDYGVFLLGRIKEAHDQGLPNREAVAVGIERSGRLITAAALLFCVAVGALCSSSILSVQELGFGAAFAVAVDASLVRAFLVPSLMALLGDWNWWAPRPLRRLYNRFAGSGTKELAAALPQG